MDASEWLPDYRRRVAEAGVRALRTQTALREVQETASSRDGAVTVTVDPGGALRRLVLGERADRLSRAQLAETVLATAGEAHERAQRRVEEIAAEFRAPR